MTEEEKKDEKDESKEESKEDKEKSNLDSSLDALTETIKGFDINGLKDEIKNVGDKVESFEARVKALEEPTDLPLKPKVSAEEDIGAKVKTPDTYQSNSTQAGIRESDPEAPTGESDKNALSMQEKGLQTITKSEQVFTTETPRPGAALEAVEKSTGLGLNEVLKAAREQGHEGLGAVGKRILKGDFGSPYEGDVPQW